MKKLEKAFESDSKAYSELDDFVQNFETKLNFPNDAIFTIESFPGRTIKTIEGPTALINHLRTTFKPLKECSMNDPIAEKLMKDILDSVLGAVGASIFASLVGRGIAEVADDVATGTAKVAGVAAVGLGALFLVWDTYQLAEDIKQKSIGDTIRMIAENLENPEL